MDYRTGLLLLTICWTGVDGQTLTQSEPAIKTPGAPHRMTCTASGLDVNVWMYWIMQTARKELRWIAYISSDSSSLYSGVPNRFTVSRDINRKQVYLQINGVQTEDSAVYYCCCKLLLTPVVKPVVSVYPAASRAHLEGKSSLLCLASAMFPPLVQLSWKRQKENGPLEDLLPAEGEQLVIRKSACTAAILLIHQQEKRKYKYRCYVRHEGGPVEAETQQGNEGLVTVDRPPTEHMLTDCFLLTFSHHQIS
uniref:Immunoglobulin heavy variable 6-1 n=1 Tax=Sander lucioperca TaxID=283035 RepID=A0A8C9ZQA7_SANLU